MSKKKRRVVKYENGNYTVELNTKTGIKTKKTYDSDFISDYPELIRLRIIGNEDTDMPWNGSENDYREAVIGETFYESLHPHQEIVLSNGIMQHIGITDILNNLNECECITSLRMTQRDFMENIGWLMSESMRGKLFGVDIIAYKPDDYMFDMMKRFKKANMTIIIGDMDNDSVRACLGWGGDVLLSGIPDTAMGLIYKSIRREEIAYKTDWCKRFIPRIAATNQNISLDLDALKMLGFNSQRDVKEIERLASEAISDSLFIDMVSGVCALGDASGRIRDKFDTDACNIDDAFKKLLNDRIG